jgi:aspartyl-tRNA(Asn)/glutamyl-tRNA(Gln) amidotransferase subunit B
MEESPVTAAHLGELLGLVEEGAISGKMAKTVFEEMAQSGRAPREIVAARGLAQVSDSAALEAVVARVLEEAPAEVSAYKAGKTKLMGFFVGQVMRATRGQANPQMVNELLQKMLAG